MIKHLLKIIRQQRKANGWIFVELLVVVCALWWIADGFYVDTRIYNSPMGYDISNTWRLQLDNLSPNAPDYVHPEEYSSTGSEDLQKLQNHLRQHAAVESVCIAFYSAPYSFGNSWTSIEPENDTTLQTQSFQVRRVSAEYFDVFRIKDIYGKEITPVLANAHHPIVISEDMALLFFKTKDAVGKRVKYGNSEEGLTIKAVAAPYRDTEYNRSEPFFYDVMTGDVLKSLAGFSASSAELCVRMNRNLSQEEMNNFLQEMGDRLTVNNLYVYSANPTEFYKELQISGTKMQQSRKLSLLAFLLVNVLFGIVGTFWLRTQYRHGELGLRIALGASKSTLRTYMYAEGLLLLFLTVPFSLIFALNIIYVDVLDTYRLPYTVGRFLIAYGGTYLLMAAMICLGIFFPVRNTERIAPAEALHYE